MTYHWEAERDRLDAATATQMDPFARIPSADDRADELTRRHRDNLAGARHQAQLHGPPGALIRLFSGKLFRTGPLRQTVPVARGITGEAALGRPRAPVTSTRSRPSDDGE